MTFLEAARAAPQNGMHGGLQRPDTATPGSRVADIKLERRRSRGSADLWKAETAAVWFVGRFRVPLALACLGSVFT
jgi:hypothetical protein